MVPFASEKCNFSFRSPLYTTYYRIYLLFQLVSTSPYSPNHSIFLILTGAQGVSIKELRVPPYVKNGTNSAAILDCLYSLESREQTDNAGLVVKWFFNKSPNPVYQWIHNRKPQEFGALKGRLWLDYKASDNNATAYRALYILNPTVELSGEYKCTVSTIFDEDFSIKKMIVWGEFSKIYSDGVGAKVVLFYRSSLCGAGIIETEFWGIV